MQPQCGVAGVKALGMREISRYNITAELPRYFAGIE